jgi:hypothetical protein
MTWPRPPRCRACGGRDRLTQVPVTLMDWEWLHSSCAKTYVHRGKPAQMRHPSSKSTSVADVRDGASGANAPAAFFQHPLMKSKRGGDVGYGYIRSSLTDAWGWMRITPPSSST